MMKTSDKLLLWASGISLVLTGGGAWIVEGAGPWWAYLLVFLIIAGGLWKTMLEQTGLENVANLKDKDRR